MSIGKNMYWEKTPIGKKVLGKVYWEKRHWAKHHWAKCIGKTSIGDNVDREK